jgi:hypothetical protein
MYRNRNIDIAIATIAALLGGLAAAKHLPGQVTIPLGTALFFAPGYLWSEAILSQRLPGIERAMTTVGMALILPILGGFLFYGLHIPLFKSSWVGLLVVLTLLGVVAVAIQRLREAPAGQPQQPRRNQPPPRRGGSVVLHSFIFGLAAVIGIGTVAFSVKNADAQKFPGYTMLSMTAVVNNSAAQNAAILSNNPVAQNAAAQAASKAQGNATQAHLFVANHQGVPEQYQLKLLTKGKVTKTWTITLNNGQTWQQTIAWTTKYSLLADLYLLPNGSTPFHYANNGTCISNIKVLPTALRSEIPLCPAITPASPAATKRKP